MSKLLLFNVTNPLLYGGCGILLANMGFPATAWQFWVILGLMAVAQAYVAWLFVTETK